ncbi:hypothetical protein SHKM778_56240 [Streptomyces sp. KM77-8]|uniref:PIG-L family deacetylase n=1 Tax=Streptomyces haneummycinicus TaxID=3074435 RepID=A0AAT9HPQ3_9ACTN
MTHDNAPVAVPRSTLVVTAHAGDFVWRAGGAIALAASRGEKVTLACLTFGERGESAKAWREGKQLAEIKALRRAEAEKAAAILGAEVRFFDAGDYPLLATPELTDRLVEVYRATQPDVVLTHPVEDPYNGDHPAANRMALEARVLAQAIGYPGEGEIIGAPPVFYFEPHQPEMSGFRPEVLLDITEVWRPSARPWSASPPSGTCGTTTPTWPSAAVSSWGATPAPTWACRTRPWPRRSCARTRRSRRSWHEWRRRHRPPKADAKDVEALAGYGVATISEAMGRTGLLGPGVRPVQQGLRVAGTAVTVLSWPGDNLMLHAAVEQCGEGDLLVVTTTSPPRTACSANCSPPPCGGAVCAA